MPHTSYISTDVGEFKITEKGLSFIPTSKAMGYSMDFHSLAELLMSDQAKQAEDRAAEKQEREKLIHWVDSSFAAAINHLRNWPTWRLKMVKAVLDVRY